MLSAIVINMAILSTYKSKNLTERYRLLINTSWFLLYPMRSMGESIGIGLEASLTSKGPQVKTTEPMDSIKVTYCSIQLGCFAKIYMGSRPAAKKCHFF